MPALEFADLRDEGLVHIQRLAGDAWTDHNAHDPGITILEQVCYALTDLAYRAEYALPDLLTREGEEASGSSVYGPEQVLPTAPVTLVDLRKVVMDVRGVQNAWIDLVDEPLAAFDAATGQVSFVDPAAPASAPTGVNVTPIRVKGLYRVRIQKSDVEDVDGGTIRREVALRLARMRPLCEDFEDITVLDQQGVAISAALEIDAVEDAGILLADVYRAIAEYFAPAVRFHTLEEMLERGFRMDQIFEGPLLESGFIDPDEMAQLERRDNLRISDLIHVLMSVPGVSTVKSVHFRNADGSPTKDWLVSIPADRTARFDLRGSDISLEKRALRVDPGIREAAHALHVKRTFDASRPRGSAALGRGLGPAPGRDRNVARYYPIQQQLPMVYGVGSAGLPASAPPERRAQALQLKAYLMFFEQILANQFAQLGNAGRLFSFHDDTGASYFSQRVVDQDGTLGLSRLTKVRREESHEDILRRLCEEPDGAGTTAAPGLRRRHRFLDHLLARFGEQLRDYSLLEAGTDSASAASGEDVARAKRAFLRDYARLGRDRGVAFNYVQPSADSASGLEETLRRKLGIVAEEERFYMIEHVLLRPIVGDVYQQGVLLRGARSADPFSLQVSFVFPRDKGRYPDPTFRQYVEQSVREETPAHLTTYVLWKDDAGIRAFAAAHAAWTRELQSVRVAQWGLGT